MINTKKGAFGFGALIQTTRNYFKYPNNFLLVPRMALTEPPRRFIWKFYKVWRKLTGREVLSNHWCFNPYECGCAGDETVSETRIVKEKEISEKEFRAIKEKDEEAGMIR